MKKITNEKDNRWKRREWLMEKGMRWWRRWRLQSTVSVIYFCQYTTHKKQTCKDDQNTEARDSSGFILADFCMCCVCPWKEWITRTSDCFLPLCHCPISLWQVIHISLTDTHWSSERGVCILLDHHEETSISSSCSVWARHLHGHFRHSPEAYWTFQGQMFCQHVAWENFECALISQLFCP